MGKKEKFILCPCRVCGNVKSLLCSKLEIAYTHSIKSKLIYIKIVMNIDLKNVHEIFQY